MPSVFWNPEVSTGDILTVIGFVFTTVGLLYTAGELRRNTINQRMQFLLEIAERYFADTAARNLFYQIDYGKYRFELEKFVGSDDERLLDGMLYNFDLIGRLVKTNTVSIDEVSILAFQASRVLRNSEVRKYLAWLDGEYRSEGRVQAAHMDARYLMMALEKASDRVL